MGIDADGAEDFVGSRILTAYLLGSLEAVYERAQAAFAVGVGEEMESLETLGGKSACRRLSGRTLLGAYDGISKVGSVSMWLEAFACVGSVFR